MRTALPLRWTGPSDYVATVRFGEGLRIMAKVRRLIAVTASTFVAAAAISLSSGVAPTGISRAILIALLVVGATMSVAWWRGPWPRERTSMAFVIGSDLLVGLGLLLYQDPIAALPLHGFLVFIGLYAALLHERRFVIFRSALVAALVVALMARVIATGDDHWLASAYLVALVLPALALPFVLQVPWGAVRRRAWESLADHQTGLPNRRGLASGLAGARRAAPGEVHLAITFDLDGFKEVNDLHGHAAGDDVLRRIAARLEAWDRPGRWARIGGEEFAVLTTVSSDDSRLIGKQVGDLVHDTEDPHPRTASIGIAVATEPMPDHLDDRRAWFDSLLTDADAAMYMAKAAGGARVRLAEGSDDAESDRSVA